MSKSRYKSFIIPMMLVLVSVAIMAVTTFTALHNRLGASGDVDFGKIEISTDNSFSSNVSLKDVLPGDTVMRDVAFHKAPTSESMFVRTKVTFDTDSTVPAVLALVDELNTIEFDTTTGSAYQWGNYEDGYYYLLDKTNTDKAYEITTTQTIKFSDAIVIPFELESLEDDAQYFENIKMSVEIQAVQSAGVTNTFVNVKSKLIESFNEKIAYEDFRFALNEATKTATLFSYSGDATNVVIPDSVGKVVSDTQGEQQVYEYQNVNDFGDRADTDMALYEWPVSVTIANGTPIIYSTIEEMYSGFETDFASIDLENDKIVVKECALWTCKYGKGYAVTSIAGSAFTGNVNIKSVRLGENVVKIPSSAFKNCSNLTSVSLNNIQTIGEFAFQFCTSLTNVIIPERVMSIEDWTFQGCVSLASVTLPNGLTSIGKYAFHGCCSLVSIVMPTGVTSIGNYAFSDCYALAEVYNLSTLSLTIGETANGDVARYAKVIHTNMETPSRIERAGGVSYYKDTDNKYIVLAGDKNITNVDLKANTKEMNQYAFQDCKNLTSIIIPTGVMRIEDKAFYDCRNLTSIVIPASVTSIGFSTFSYCYALAEIYNLSTLSLTIGGTANGDVAQYAKVIHTNMETPSRIERVGGVSYYKDTDNKYIVLAGDKNITNVDLKANTKEINQYAFQDCKNLTSIVIPTGVTSIGRCAFGSCTSLVNVTIPNGVTSIGDNLFGACTRLVNVTIPNSVESIGAYAFYSCSNLTNVTIPSNVTSIGRYAFNGCTALGSVIFSDQESDWYVASSSTATSGTDITDLSDASNNATLLKDTYYNKYWIKKTA